MYVHLIQKGYIPSVQVKNKTRIKESEQTFILGSTVNMVAKTLPLGPLSILLFQPRP